MLNKRNKFKLITESGKFRHLLKISSKQKQYLQQGDNFIELKPKAKSEKFDTKKKDDK